MEALRDEFIEPHGRRGAHHRRPDFLRGDLILYGERFSRFLPSATGIQVGLAAALIMGLIGAALAFRPWRVRKKVRWLNILPLRVATFFVLMAAFGHFSFSFALPEFYTDFYGSPADERLPVIGWNLPFRSHCSGPKVPGGWFVPGFALCAPDIDSDKYPVGSVLRLHGLATVFGLKVQSFEVDPSAAGARPTG